MSELCNKLRFKSVKEQKNNRGFSFGSNRDRVVLPVQKSYFDPKFSLYKNPDEKKAVNDKDNEKLNSNWNVSTIPRFPETTVLNQVPAPNFYRLPPEIGKSVWIFNWDRPRQDHYAPKNNNPG